MAVSTIPYLFAQSTGNGTINTAYATESSHQWVRKGNMVFVPIGLHLKNIGTFTAVNIGSNFPPSVGNSYCVSYACKNDAPVHAVFRVDSAGVLSIQTRGTSFGSTAETITGCMMYVTQ